MTVDECIKDCEAIMFGAKMLKQTEAYRYNRQLVMWLKELKKLRKEQRIVYENGYKEGYEDGYAEATISG